MKKKSYIIIFYIFFSMSSVKIPAQEITTPEGVKVFIDHPHSLDRTGSECYPVILRNNIFSVHGVVKTNRLYSSKKVEADKYNNIPVILQAKGLGKKNDLDEYDFGLTIYKHTRLIWALSDNFLWIIKPFFDSTHIGFWTPKQAQDGIFLERIPLQSLFKKQKVNTKKFLFSELNYPDCTKSDIACKFTSFYPVNDFDFYLFTLTENKMKVWLNSRKEHNPVLHKNDQCGKLESTLWSLKEEFIVPFGEHFQTFVKEGFYGFITESGDFFVYSIGQNKEKALTSLWKSKKQPVTAIIEDLDISETYLFTENQYFKLSEEIIPKNIEKEYIQKKSDSENILLDYYNILNNDPEYAEKKRKMKKENLNGN